MTQNTYRTIILPRRCTECSPSWKANGQSASQKIPGILYMPKFNYRVRNTKPLVPFLSHTDPLHPLLTQLTEDPHSVKTGASVRVQNL
jgi:hypothetical protein